MFTLDTMRFIKTGEVITMNLLLLSTRLNPTDLFQRLLDFGSISVYDEDGSHDITKIGPDKYKIRTVALDRSSEEWDHYDMNEVMVMLDIVSSIQWNGDIVGALCIADDFVDDEFYPF